jgi:molybdenum cofactor cytidylyltransferase
MGRPKQLLPLGDKLVINHCCDNIIAAGLGNIVVVIGPDDNGTRGALSGLPVSFAVNDNRGSDMAGSLRIGLQVLEQSSSGVLVCLADHPLSTSDTMIELVRLHHESPDRIIIPSYNGKRGHPSLFPTNIIREIFSGITLRDIVRQDEKRVRVIDVPDEGVVLDMDSPADYERVLKRASRA